MSLLGVRFVIHDLYGRKLILKFHASKKRGESFWAPSRQNLRSTNVLELQVQAGIQSCMKKTYSDRKCRERQVRKESLVMVFSVFGMMFAPIFALDQGHLSNRYLNLLTKLILIAHAPIESHGRSPLDGMYEIKNRRIGDCPMMPSKSRNFLINIFKLAGLGWLLSKHVNQFSPCHGQIIRRSHQAHIWTYPQFRLFWWFLVGLIVEQPFSRSNLLAAINVDTVSTEVSAEVSRLCGCMVFEQTRDWWVEICGLNKFHWIYSFKLA